MAAPKIITIGNAGTGGWWYAINMEVFEDGFPTEQGSCWNLYRPNPQANVFFAQIIWHRTANPAASSAS